MVGPISKFHHSKITHKQTISRFYGVSITYFGGGKGDNLPGVPGKQNSLFMLYIV